MSSLAIYKPGIRRVAKVGDWVAGLGSKNACSGESDDQSAARQTVHSRPEAWPSPRPQLTRGPRSYNDQQFAPEPLIDRGLNETLVGLDVAQRPSALANYSQFPSAVAVTIAAPPALRYSFVTGDPSNPMAPS
jgi:hypothetical protein